MQTLKQWLSPQCHTQGSRKRDLSAPYLLIDLNADGALGDVPDASRAAVVELVRHALVDGAIHLDVDVVADLVGAQVGGERDVTLLAEGAREGVARARADPVAGWHPPCLLRTSAAAARVGAVKAGVTLGFARIWVRRWFYRWRNWGNGTWEMGFWCWRWAD
jgi:hypothetical protein